MTTTLETERFSTAEELLESARKLKTRYETRLGSINIWHINLYQSAVEAAQAGVKNGTPVEELRATLVEILKKDGGLASSVSGIFHIPGTPLAKHLV